MKFSSALAPVYAEYEVGLVSPDASLYNMYLGGAVTSTHLLVVMKRANAVSTTGNDFVFKKLLKSDGSFVEGKIFSPAN